MEVLAGLRTKILRRHPELDHEQLNSMGLEEYRELMAETVKGDAEESSAFYPGEKEVMLRN
jgi:hypothetical protein